MDRRSPFCNFVRRGGNPWRLRTRIGAIAFGFLLIAVPTILVPVGSLAKRAILSPQDCRYPAIYNFGDSNSDTGSVSAAFGRVHPPNGDTFFGKPSGRYSDGRLIIDFIAQQLGLPYLSAYLDAIEGIFQHGAGFAASGTTIQPVDGKLYGLGFNPLYLNIQVSQFEQLKERTAELYKRGKAADLQNRLPRLKDFSEALYTFDIGQNDIHYGLMNMTEEEVMRSVPDLVNQVASAIEKLHQLGARTFWIHNTGPIGCLPYFTTNNPPKPGNADEIGCIKSFNDVAEEFNNQLRDRVSQLRIQLPDAALVYADIYSAKYYLIREAKKNGFVDPFGYCCKHPDNPELKCWDKLVTNGTDIFATSCETPSNYISWDSIHYTEAANKWIANQIFDGSLSDPPVPLVEACRKQVVS